MLSPSQSFRIPLARREESFSIAKASAPPPLPPPSQGGEKDRSLAPSFHPAQQKHASRNRPSSSVKTNFAACQTDPGRSAPDPGASRPQELRADRRQSRFGHSHLPPRRHRPSGDVRPQALRPDRVSR